MSGSHPCALRTSIFPSLLVRIFPIIGGHHRASPSFTPSLGSPTLSCAASPSCLSSSCLVTAPIELQSSQDQEPSLPSCCRAVISICWALSQAGVIAVGLLRLVGEADINKPTEVRPLWPPCPFQSSVTEPREVDSPVVSPSQRVGGWTRPQASFSPAQDHPTQVGAQ